MRKLVFTAATLLCLGLAVQAFGQANASLSGTVTDAAGAVMPGVSITATNENTGVVSNSVSNDAGVYSYANLLPGSYTVQAALQGFQTKIFTKVSLGSGQQARLNFRLEIAGVQTQVEVTTQAEELLLESSSSVGDVLGAQRVAELPQVNRNALDLVKVMSGVVMTDNTIFNANESSFAGVGANGVNIQRDGVTVNDVRWPAGINAATRVNPDLVGEFRMILAPVDAEAGRGNAQIQISTKSGTNDYHGALVWTGQNTALDPNTWENNRNGVTPPWRNMHNYTASVGGPIVKNKTFFFALYDGQMNKIRSDYNALTLTPCAQRGVFRYYDNWTNGNRLQLATPTSANPQMAVVDINGNPLAPATNPNGTPHNGILRYASVFGQITNRGNLNADCSNLEINGRPWQPNVASTAPWDPLRPRRDPSGYVDDFLNSLPQPNNYDIGDGLNTAGHRWARTLKGTDNLFGIGEDTYRRQFNLRLDHNFNDAHRINGSWSWEKSWADDNFVQWPDGFGGKSERRPMVLTVNMISSIKPTLLSELRFGMSRTGSNIFSPFTNPDTGEEVQQRLKDLGMVTSDGQIVVAAPGQGVFNFRQDGANTSNWYGGRGNLSYSGLDISPRYTLGDTMSWTKKAHTLRFGGEYRYASSQARNRWTAPFAFGFNDYPAAMGGETPTSQTPQDFSAVLEPGSVLGGANANAGNQRAMRDLLIFQSGSLQALRQWRFINNINDKTWNDPALGEGIIRDTVQKEFSFFFKDDWKATPDLTLNLGVRYDYFGVPYLKNGLTTGLVGGGGALFGPTGGFDNWFAPIGAGSQPSGGLVALQPVGPGSPNAGERLYPKDTNNFGPAIGFAYQLPWLGKGQTTIRGGYQVSYIGNNGRASAIQTAAGQAPGTTYTNQYTTAPAGSYLGFKDLGSFNGIPVPSNVLPGIAAFTAYERNQSITAFAPNYVSPYVQNLTFAITRNVTSNLAVDLRYVGTLTRKNFSTLNINNANFLSNGLLQAFNEARAGGNPQLLTNLLRDVKLTPFAQPVSDTYPGGQALREAAFFAAALPAFAPGWLQNLNTLLAMGNYNGLANALNVLSKPGGQIGRYMEDNGFPVNFIKASPQFDNATFEMNGGHSNYHSFQGQVTLRPTAGVNFQSTYTWSKNLGISGAPTDPRDLFGDYTLLPAHRSHSWVTYGNWDLPIGPGKLLAGSSSGVLAALVGGWQTSWISNVTSGQPLSISAQDMLYANGVPDQVGDFDRDLAGVFWEHGAREGNYFENRYTTTRDPQCAGVAASIQNLCTLQAIQDTQSGQIVLQNPQPGARGNMGRNVINSPMRWNVDMAMAKSFQISESKSFRIRVDAANIFNHVIASGTLGSTGMRIVFPTAPVVNMNSTTTRFGAMPFKVGGRTFQFMARFDF
jgi:hypothetical protein